MSGIFVKLDAEYPSDDEFIEAGPMAELLYIRALCFCKRKMLDGIVNNSQLPTVGLGIPGVKKLPAKLVEVGLWQATEDGWFICAWFKRNKPADDIIADREVRRLASVEANHAQHHLGPGKRRSPKCELCRSGLSTKSAPVSEADRRLNRLQEPEPEPEPEPISTTTDETPLSQLPDSEGSDRIKAIAKRYAEITYELGRNGINSPTGFKNGQYRKALTNPDCERLAREYPTAPIDVLACALNGDKHSLVYHERQAS